MLCCQLLLWHLHLTQLKSNSVYIAPIPNRIYHITYKVGLDYTRLLLIWLLIKHKIQFRPVGMSFVIGYRS